MVWFWSTVAAGGVPALLSPLSSNEVTLAGELDNVNKLFNGPKILTTKQLSRLFRPIASMNTVTVQTIAMVKIEEGFGMDTIDEAVGHEDELATVLFTSFDHSAALCENHLHAMYAGANQVMVPAIDFVRGPARFWKVLSDHRIAYTFAPNFFIAAATRAINEMNDFDKKRMKLDFSELCVIMCGGEANKTATLAAAEKVLTEYGAPKCSVKASYGLSETCSAFFYNLESPTYDVKRKYVFASAGKHLPQHELRLVDESRKQRYFNNEAATSACMTPDGWFDTGDLGILDDQGNLRIVGRSKEVLIINGQNYSSFELEHAIELANISGLNKSWTASFSIWAEDANADSEDIVILFNPVNDAIEDTPELRDTVAQINEAAIRFCRKRPMMVIPLPKQKLPKSTIGKLSRAKLKKSLQAGHFDEFKLPERILCEETGLKSSELHLDIALADLNIDSLGYLRHIPDRPIYALRVRGFHKNETPFDTLDEMLETYIAGIKNHQPKGKRLEAAGEQVAFCGGIDNPADLTRIQVRAKQRNFIIDLLHFFQLLDMETALRWEEEMDDIPDEKFTAAIFARFPDGTLENLDLTVPKVETWQRINKNMQEITRTYIPTGTVSKYDIFWVPPLPQYKCTDEEWRHDWLAKWKSHVTGAKQSDVDQEDSEGMLRYHRVEGTHFTILRPENIEVFQRALNRALELRGV
ncbi:putative non-ribosomal peptide synthase protein [Neofusicoccum parvum UCRNP2]|uniref:Putative non-ribosomal peptide synthase protein n=1 Tax=Botryosphaeria parva (strain UCR-NP2) TaxID=1287680 RepID=R1GQH5_BOTPV|nr:putative non-ribosomal peptide synthase protein [Neofusicoccum parvum UCRNP2]